MSIHELIAVHILHLADDIRHPLKLLLSTRHPQKVHLNMHGEVDQHFVWCYCNIWTIKHYIYQNIITNIKLAWLVQC